ncbi:hypothetical protein TOPH_06320 [Tolypocladium ophioglossoides CBS 100239]|uniref:Uncharacterized protein n=1 Tax=Tolypocladium ophioglossoides (strain CBS 100239) TaxID=1163406 RepID=A0A0L0N4V3_TOLOC|nr:hypothetical protein TOPH_06320 [Tolypocladium ophioglossoides CBS 100239]
MCALPRKGKKVPAEGDWRQYETAPASGTAGVPGMTGPPSAVAGAPAGASAQQGSAATANLPGPAPHTAGPHRHDMINKLDPTVDSRSGGVQIIGPGTRTSPEAPVSHHGPTPTNAPATAAVPQSAYNQGAGYNDGPQHNYRLANTFDPRGDSAPHTTAGGALPPDSAPDRQGLAATPGMNAPGGAYGPHSSRFTNAADPHVDSAIDGRAATDGQHGAHQEGRAAYPGPAPNTAGPHRSDLLNKLDPSVDSKPTGTQMREHRGM